MFGNIWNFLGPRGSYRASVRPPVPSRPVHPQQFFLSSKMSWNTAVRPQRPLKSYIFWKPMMSAIQIRTKYKYKYKYRDKYKDRDKRENLRHLWCDNFLKKGWHCRQASGTPQIIYFLKADDVRYPNSDKNTNTNTKTETNTKTKTNKGKPDTSMMWYIFEKEMTKGFWIWYATGRV